MSELSALLGKPGTPRAWFFTKEGDLVELRMVSDGWEEHKAAADAFGTRYWITLGKPLVEHFPPEWWVWDRRSQRTPIRNGQGVAIGKDEHRPIKRITAQHISAAHMWVLHHQAREG